MAAFMKTELAYFRNDNTIKQQERSVAKFELNVTPFSYTKRTFTRIRLLVGISVLNKHAKIAIK